MSNDKKILFLDLETAPALVYSWSLRDVNIGLEQIKDNGGILCVAAKFLGDKTMTFASVWTDGYEAMLRVIYGMILEADAVVTYNGDKFDIPKLRGAFMLAGFPPIPPLTSIDVYKAVKKNGFISNKLAFVGPLFKLGSKTQHSGFSLWRGVMDGVRKDQVKMERYCKQDVKLLESLYLRVRPYINNHPHLGLRTSGHSCSNCGSDVVQSRGYRRTRYYKIQRIQCQTCGSWSDGKRTAVTAPDTGGEINNSGRNDTA